MSGEDRVTVQLGDAGASIRIYDPTTGVEPARALSNVRSLELTLSDHPLVISISVGRQ